jgi:hypothetical protein
MYDPEGFLGCLNSNFITYLGIVFGEVLIYVSDFKLRSIFSIAIGLVYGLLGGLLCWFK